jgi:hypothetical protein
MIFIFIFIFIFFGLDYRGARISFFSFFFIGSA